MRLLKYFKHFFKKPPSVLKQKRLKIKDVEPGDYICIEWSKMEGGIGYIECLNNDPLTYKIFLEKTWANYKEAKCPEKEKLVLDYNSLLLKNFHLLNEHNKWMKINKIKTESEDSLIDNYNIIELQKQMNDALSKEDYRLADNLQKKIDKLIKK